MPMKQMNYLNANCMKFDPDEFFPEKGSAQVQAQRAKDLCHGRIEGILRCPRMKECLEFAIENRERFGVWGGKSERERTRIIRNRKIDKELKSIRAVVGQKTAKQRKQRLKESSHFFVIDRSTPHASTASRGRDHRTKAED